VTVGDAVALVILDEVPVLLGVLVPVFVGVCVGV
jgi:hypothetical protein